MEVNQYLKKNYILGISYSVLWSGKIPPVKIKPVYVYECLCKFVQVWKKEGKETVHAADDGYFKALKIK